MTTESSEASDIVSEVTDEVTRDTTDAYGNRIIEALVGNPFVIPQFGHLPHTPVYVLWGEDFNQTVRLGTILPEPVAISADATSWYKTYEEVFAEWREATGTNIVPLMRLDATASEAVVVENVRTVVKTALAELFPDDFIFDPIAVEVRTDQDDDEYLKIHIVFEGASERITPDLSGGLIRHIRPQLAELGFTGVPCWSFVEKSEWVKYFQSERDEPARTD